MSHPLDVQSSQSTKYHILPPPIHLGLECQGSCGWQCTRLHGMASTLIHGKLRSSSPTTQPLACSSGPALSWAPTHRRLISPCGRSVAWDILTCTLTHHLFLSATQQDPSGALQRGPPRPLPRKLLQTKAAPSLQPPLPGDGIRSNICQVMKDASNIRKDFYTDHDVFPGAWLVPRSCPCHAPDAG